jgi:signal transduction histidine kinase
VAQRTLATRLTLGLRPHGSRLRERRFWITQALMALALAVIYGYDLLSPGEGVGGGIHDIPVMFLLAPVVYAALVFGLEGALQTAAFAVLLTVPHMLLADRDEFEWLGDLGTLVIVALTGVMLAWRVEEERGARLRAEAASKRLGLLNELANTSDRIHDVRLLLRSHVSRIRRGLTLDSAWVAYNAGGAALDPLVIGESTANPSGEGFTPPSDGASDVVLIPLAAEGRALGSLGAQHATGVTVEDRETLSAAAQQLAVTVENRELQTERRQALTAYARQITNAQEEERRRIARELHDGTAQTLTGLCRGLDIMVARASKARTLSMLNDEAGALRSVAESALADLRRVTRDLRPSVLDDLGLLAAIDWLAADLKERTGLTVDINDALESGLLAQLTAEEEVSIFRIVQEAISNIEKHAAATRVRIDIDSVGRRIRLAVSDDGHGFAVPSSPSRLAGEGCYGLLGMQERAQLCGGMLQISSRHGRGATVELVVGTDDAEAPPLHAKA